MANEALLSRLQDLLRSEKWNEIGKILAEISDPLLQQEALVSVALPLFQPEGERYDLLYRLNEALSDSIVSKYLSLYGAAVFEGLRGNVNEVDRLMLLALKKVQEAIELELPILPTALTILIHAEYLDTDCARTLKANEELSSKPTLKFELAEDCEWIFLVSSNGLYFDRFAKSYVDSVEALGVRAHIHFQLIEPTVNSARQFEEMKRYSSLKLSCETESREFRPVYLICRRFQVAHELMRKFRKPILITDIDIQVKPRLQELLKLRADSYDLALFEIPHTPPMLTCHCSLVLIQPTVVAESFLKLYSLYISKKLKEEPRLWVLDQCAMYVLSRLTAKRELKGLESLQWTDLHAVLSGSLDDYQVEQTNVAEKQSLRQKQWADFGNPEILGIAEEVYLRRTQSRH
jgi:hypothetical protein